MAHNLLNTYFILSEVVLDSSGTNFEISNLLTHVKNVMKCTSDPLKQNEHLHYIWQFKFMTGAKSKIANEAKGTHKVWQEIPYKRKNQVNVGDSLPILNFLLAEFKNFFLEVFIPAVKLNSFDVFERFGSQIHSLLPDL